MLSLFFLQECFSAPWMVVMVYSKTRTAVSTTTCVIMVPLYINLALKEQSLNLLHTTHVIHPRNPTVMYEPSQQTTREAFCKVAIRSAVQCPHSIRKIYEILRVYICRQLYQSIKNDTNARSRNISFHFLKR